MALLAPATKVPTIGSWGATPACVSSCLGQEGLATVPWNELKTESLKGSLNAAEEGDMASGASRNWAKTLIYPF